MSTAQSNGVRTTDEAFNKLLDADHNAEHIPDAFRRSQPLPPGPALIPVERYVSRRYHELEKERLWSRVWQMAAHEDDFPNVGDVVPYDIADKSYLVVRTAADEYKAYHNACLHRGRKLRESRAKGLDELRCPFHGWAWELDGALKQVPCAYDYTGLDRDAESLPEVKVSRWGRYVFINPDPDCAPLEEHMGDLATQFEVLPYERRYKEAHVAKIIRANWKLVQEAFMEAYHVFMTHPQILMHGVHDSDTKYDAFGNYSRAITCGALGGEPMPEWEALPGEDGVIRFRHPLNGWIYEGCDDDAVRITTPKGLTGKFDVNARWLEGETLDANPHLCNMVAGLKSGPDPDMAMMKDPELIRRIQERVADRASPRAFMSEARREALRATIPSIADSIPDIELTSSIYLTLFPNWHPWGSFNRINYRFRPNGDNHEECIMECMYLVPIPEDGDYTPASEIHWLTADDDWTVATELGGLSKVFNQDTINLQYVHQGLKTTAKENVRLAEYNELKIRHFHQLYEKWLNLE